LATEKVIPHEIGQETAMNDEQIKYFNNAMVVLRDSDTPPILVVSAVAYVKQLSKFIANVLMDNDICSRQFYVYL
jgi:hypothetical protein